MFFQMKLKIVHDALPGEDVAAPERDGGPVLPEGARRS